MGWLTLPRDWIANFGEIAKFCADVVARVYSGRVLRFFGESLRQAGVSGPYALVLGSELYDQVFGTVLEGSSNVSALKPALLIWWTATFSGCPATVPLTRLTVARPLGAPGSPVTCASPES